MGRYSKTLAQLEAELRFRCHRYFVETGAKKYKLAADAGISDTLLKDIDRPDFPASIKTLQRLDEIIPEDWEPSINPSVKSIPSPATDLVLGYKVWDGRLSQSRKVYLRQELLHGLDPDQIERCAEYIEKVREPDGRLLERKIKMTVLHALAPQCAIHVFNVGEDDPTAFYIEKWDNGTGLWNGVDMTGMRFSELEDDALRACQLEDYETCRETQWPSLSVINRRYGSGENRNFVRLMYPFEGEDGRPKILSITRPQQTGLAAQILEKRIPAEPLVIDNELRIAGQRR